MFSPQAIPSLAKGEACVWDVEKQQAPYVARFNPPKQFLQRHKKEYAQGDMNYNSFIFTGPDNKLQLKANNLMLFVHMAEGVDDDTWLYHPHRKDFTRWFRNCVHDDELAGISEAAENMKKPAESKQHILGFIAKNYMV